MTFGKDMKIGEGQKYDITSISKDGLSAEELAKLEKKNRKLIDIYNKDGNKDLSGLELSLAMDGFQVADMNKDSKLSKEELKTLAAAMNETYGLEGDDAVSFKDLKRFLKDVTKITKGHEKDTIENVYYDSAIDSIAKQNEWTPVEGQQKTFVDKNGKYYVVDENKKFVRAKKDESIGNYLPMSNAEIIQEEANEYAKANGFEPFADQPFYTKEGEPVGKKYIWVNNEMVRAKEVEGGWAPMNDEEIAAQDDAIRFLDKQEQERKAEEQRKKDLATPKDYTVQNGETLTGLLKRSLKARGIENPTKEQIAEAKAEFIKNNPKGVHGPKGQEILWAGDVVKIAGNLENKNNADEVKAAYRAFDAKKRAEAEAKAEKERQAQAREAEKQAKGLPPYAPVEQEPELPKADLNPKAPGFNIHNPLDDLKGKDDVKIPYAPPESSVPDKTPEKKADKPETVQGKEDKPDPKKIANMNKYPLMEELPNGYTRRDAPGYNDAYFDKNGNRITKAEYQKVRGQKSREIDNMVSSPIIEQLPNGYTKRDVPGFNDAYYTKEGKRITKAEYEAAKKAGDTSQPASASSAQKPVNSQAAANAGMKFDANGNSTTHRGYKIMADGTVQKTLGQNESINYEFYPNGKFKTIKYTNGSWVTTLNYRNNENNTWSSTRNLSSAFTKKYQFDTEHPKML